MIHDIHIKVTDEQLKRFKEVVEFAMPGTSVTYPYNLLESFLRDSIEYVDMYASNKCSIAKDNDMYPVPNWEDFVKDQ